MLSLLVCCSGCKMQKVSNHYSTHTLFLKGTAMTIRTVCRSIVLMFVLILAVHASGKDELQNYFNNTAKKVKAAENPVEKRAILSNSFQKVSDALKVVHGSSLISKEDAAGIDRFQSALQDRQSELSGIDGFVRVPDEQLNSFADYAVQDMEQAEMITMSLVTLLLIILLVVLIAR